MSQPRQGARDRLFQLWLSLQSPLILLLLEHLDNGQGVLGPVGCLTLTGNKARFRLQLFSAESLSHLNSTTSRHLITRRGPPAGQLPLAAPDGPRGEASEEREGDRKGEQQSGRGRGFQGPWGIYGLPLKPEARSSRGIQVFSSWLSLTLENTRSNWKDSRVEGGLPAARLRASHSLHHAPQEHPREIPIQCL